MEFVFDGRASDSNLVDMIWSTQSTGGGSFMSLAECHSEIVISRQYGKVTLTVRGPETIATPSPILEDAEFFGIVFKLGTFLPNFPTPDLVDNELNLPTASSQKFWLNGSTWEYPTYENADTFLERLIREELLVHEPLVESVLQNQPIDLSLRSIQRRFLRATGLTQGTVQQIERAKFAMNLLQQGMSILDTVENAHYADQPHLTRSLKRFIGQTPAQILRIHEPD